IPRPPNAFMLFRSNLWRSGQITSVVEKDHRQISRIAGKLWRALSDAERAPFNAAAQAEKLKHQERYPGYKYSPVYTRERSPRER
ncbi:high mobility group box, partial [Wolfiporia cocos MD-104 SS10]